MTVSINQRFNVTISGNAAKKMLFVHGFASNKQTWDWVAPRFKDNYQIMTFDLMGSGNSDFTYYNLERYKELDGYSDDLITLCDHHKWKDIVCIGHSVGGLIALLASIKRPDLFKQLFMIGASVRYINAPDYHGGFSREDVDQILEMMEMNYSGWASFLAPVALLESIASEKTRYVENNFLSSDPEITYNFLKVTLLMDYRPYLGQVSIPTVVLQCSEDSFVPLEAAKYMANEIKDSTLHVLNAKGHYPHVSHPDETVKAIQSFLSL